AFAQFRGLCGALGRIRTPNLLIRSQMLYPLSYECRFCCVPRVGLAHPATSSTVPRCRSGFAPFFGVTRAMGCRPGWVAPHGDVGQEMASSTDAAHSSRA